MFRTSRKQILLAQVDSYTFIHLIIEIDFTLIDPGIFQLGVLDDPLNDTRLRVGPLQMTWASDKVDAPIRRCRWWLEYKSIKLIH